jgi:hypothetical protein
MGHTEKGKKQAEPQYAWTARPICGHDQAHLTPLNDNSDSGGHSEGGSQAGKDVTSELQDSTTELHPSPLSSRILDSPSSRTLG